MNRSIHACSAGWESECDQRHVEVIIREFDFLSPTFVVMPGVGDFAYDDPSFVVQPLDPARASSYRALTARANYIAVDRADAQCAIEGLCRETSAPTEESWVKLKRVAWYMPRRTAASRDQVLLAD